MNYWTIQREYFKVTADRLATEVYSHSHGDGHKL